MSIYVVLHLNREKNKVYYQSCLMKIECQLRKRQSKEETPLLPRPAPFNVNTYSETRRRDIISMIYSTKQQCSCGFKFEEDNSHYFMSLIT
ncbi:hypothetical protein ANTPLA_LOCUS3655 [Anthophora plagiata]